MTATLTRTAPSTSDTTPANRPSLWKTGLKSGLLAATATTAVAVLAKAAGVSFETAPGEAIPVAAFAQLTLVCTMVGALIARSLRRRASRPRSTFIRTAVVLTAISCVPDLMLPASAATKVSLIVAHVVAAAIVIPALARCLPERGQS